MADAAVAARVLYKNKVHDGGSASVYDPEQDWMDMKKKKMEHLRTKSQNLLTSPDPSKATANYNYWSSILPKDNM